MKTKKQMNKNKQNQNPKKSTVLLPKCHFNDTVGAVPLLPLKVFKTLHTPPVKYFDFTQVASTTTTTASIIDLTAIPQGNAASQRLGDQAFLLGLQYKLDYFNPGANIIDPTTTCRYGFIRWKEDTTGGNVPTSNNIFQQYGFGAAPLQGMNAFYDFENYGKRLDPLLDSTFTIIGVWPATGSNYTDKSERYFAGNLDFSKYPRPLQFNPGATSGINKIYFWEFSNNASANPTQYVLTTRLYYTDS